jgi:hypothetical protein
MKPLFFLLILALSLFDSGQTPDVIIKPVELSIRVKPENC